jgi:uncharacterized membrane protein YphA (DoxX/SURF4 family)
VKALKAWWKEPGTKDRLAKIFLAYALAVAWLACALPWFGTLVSYVHESHLVWTANVVTLLVSLTVGWTIGRWGTGKAVGERSE